MSKKLMFTFMLVVFLSQFTVSTVFAAGEPAGSCAPGFTLMLVMEHNEHHHQHVGIDTDLNGDGYICMQPVTPNSIIHIHVDNNLP